MIRRLTFALIVCAAWLAPAVIAHAEDTTPVSVTPNPIVARASEPAQDGKPLGPQADTPHTAVRCHGLGGDYVAGAKQIGSSCPPTVPPEQRQFSCPSDQDRADMPKLDAIAEAEGCGPAVWQP